MKKNSFSGNGCATGPIRQNLKELHQIHSLYFQQVFYLYHPESESASSLSNPYSLLHFVMHRFAVKTVFVFVLVLGLFSAVKAQVLINELSPSNVSTILNSDNEYDDWIELYNAGTSPVNLQGVGLSDDSLSRYKFVFPNYSMVAGEHLLVFASGMNSTLRVDHWETAVMASTSWRYFIGTSQPDTNWRNLSFNPTGSWGSGQGGIGFGDGDDATSIPICKSVMMRKTFFVPDTSDILKAIFHMDYDDGFVAYLNGVEIARANLGVAGDRPTYDVLASSSHEAHMYQSLRADSFYVDPVLLKQILLPGVNVLAVETHNVSATNNDLSSIPFLSFGMRTPGLTFSNPPTWFVAPSLEYFNANFKLSRDGETVYLTDPNGTTIDTKTYTSMQIDNSCGRSYDGSASWCIFSTPTPETSNNGSTCYTGYAGIPVFSLNAGFYNSSQWLTLSTSTSGASIRYTTNGDEPTTSSRVYTAPILVNSTITIRAKVFASGYLPSETISNSYFVHEDLTLPVFSISTDSLNLWDYNTGIYATGPNADPNYPYKGANFWMDWRKPASIEFYDKDRVRQFRTNGEINIFGNYSRAKPQKSFEINLSDRFGNGSINYPLIPDKGFIDNTDNIVLRNSGTDWNEVHFRDAYMERVLRSTHSGYLATEPAVLFLNGEFWGVYTIHENHDHHWIDHNYGLSPGDYDYLKESGSTIEVKDGTDAAFFNMYNYATTQNAGTNQYYTDMCNFWDVENYTDYFIAETYYNNGDWIGDWTNNIKIWRSPKLDGKLRYLVYDLDFGLGYSGSVNDNRLGIARNPSAFSYTSNVFNSFLDNPTFKRYFINRYADLMNTIFLYSEMSAVEHSFQDSMSHDMQQHFAKWGSNMNSWQSHINSMMSFVTQRPSKVRTQIVSEFSLNGQVTLTLNSQPAGAGRIKISTITPGTLPWSGVYFNGNPVTITAIPNPGYTFHHWRSTHVITSNDFNQTTTYNFTSTDQITAYFTGAAAAPQITISEFNYHSDSLHDSGDWLELHNLSSQPIDISGWSIKDDNDYHRYTFATNTVLPGNGYLVVAEDMTKFAEQHAAVNNVVGPLGFNLSNFGDQIRLYDYRDTLYLSFYYMDIAPWPTGSDGGGYSCELSNPAISLGDGSNWFNGCIGGSPGQAYSNLLGVPVSLSGSTTFCNGNSITLVASSIAGYAYQWQRNHVDIPGATNPVLTTTLGGTYTVAVSYQGCSAVSDSTVITVVSQGPDPVVAPAYHCGPGALTLIASSTDTVYWFDSPGGTVVAVGDTLETGFLNSSATYYAQTSLTCPSALVPAVAQILDPAPDPIANDVTRCGAGSITLSASDTAAIHWYTAAVGGALVGTGPSVVIAYIPNDTVFYVEAGDVCPSQRLEVLVNVHSSPMPMVGTASRCGAGQLALTASSPDPVSWYDAPSGGTFLGSGYTFITPYLTSTTRFYAESNGGCASPRSFVDAEIIPVPLAPTTADSARCGPGTVDLYATSTEQIFWFDQPIGGTEIASGSNFTTPYLTTTTLFYVESGYFCRGPRTSVNAVIYTTPSVSLGPDTLILLSGQTATLDPGSGYASYLWSSGETTQSLVVDTTGSFSVTVADVNGCQATDSIFVNLITAVENPDVVSGWQVFPNPTTGKLTLLLEALASERGHVRLFDPAGRNVLDRTIVMNKGRNSETLDLGGLAKGIYFLRIEAGTFSKVLRITVN